MGYGPNRKMTFEEYHSVPERWRADYVLERYQLLHGKLTIEPMWGNDSLGYRHVLKQITQGARANDAASVQLSVEFILDGHVCSYSGYLRSGMAQALKKAHLTHSQASRLSTHFMSMLRDGVRRREFEDYIELWKRFISTDDLSEIKKMSEQEPNTYIGHVYSTLDA